MILCSVSELQAQTSNSSPYSRFGLGKISPNNNTLMMALGGSSSALRSPLCVNPYNPASYTSFDTTSFVFDAGLQANLMTLKTNTTSFKVNDASLAYITMGFPLTKWWKASVGLLPYSSIGYLIGSDSVISQLGKVEYGYTGSGGLNKAYIGNGFKLTKHISAGLNVAYYFGNINHERTLSYPDSNGYMRSRITSSAAIKNLIFDFGLQYYTAFSNDRNFTFGLTLTPQQSMSSSSNNLAVNYFHNYSSNIDVTRDTILFEDGTKGKVVLPMSIGTGIAFGRSTRWSTYADVRWQQWEKYTYFGESGNLKNSTRISLGGQFRPSALDVGTYWKRINYRAGVRFEMSNLELRNTRLNDIGVSFGAGLPMKKSRSTLNLAFEVGTFGSTNNNLIKENYFRFSIGAAMFEKWFLKRKYD
ncbi:MAG: hypothetical protein HXX13_16505 [Bacteroidetes bacterium]|nr:hypothetical protein [Bacteroidota bacterium]